MAQEIVVPEQVNGTTTAYVSREQADMGLPAMSVMGNAKITPKELFNMQDDEVALDDYLEKHDRKVMGVVGFYARYSDNIGTNQDGTTSSGYQVVLITSKHEAIRISSQIAVKRVQSLLNLMGTPATWEKPYDIGFKRIKVPRGNSWSMRIL